MLQFKKTFENEKLQLQELNHRLGQYLSNAKQLEQENDVLMSEIHTIRQEKVVEWENQYLAELRELRRVVDQLSFEKSKAEVERDHLWREFQMLQTLCSEESAVCKNVGEELKCCKTQLQQAHMKNSTLEDRLFQLENECKHLEDVHKQEMDQLRDQVHSRAISVVTRTYQGPITVTMEDLGEYAQNLSESWMETFEMYNKRVEELEESIKEDEFKLEDLQREKMHYASELKKLRLEAEKQNQLQVHLEEQLINLQDRCHMELDQYQGIIEELEQERRLLANTISEKLNEHQNLLQVKMGLSLEVATYKALLEGEQKEAFLWTNQYARQQPNRTDFRNPVQSYSSKQISVSSQDGRKLYPVKKDFATKYVESASSVKTSSGSSQFSRSSGVTRTFPDDLSGRDHQSSLARRDMISFTKASQSATNSVKPVPLQPGNSDVQKKVVEERSVRTKISQRSAEGAIGHQQSGDPSPTSGLNLEEANKKYVRVVSPPMMNLVIDREKEIKQEVKEIKADKIRLKEETNVQKVTVKREQTPGSEDPKKNTRGLQDVTGMTKHCHGEESLRGHVSDKSKVKVETDFKKTETETFPDEEKSIEMVCMEEIFETVMKPAGLHSKLSSSPDSKITYHVEKTKDEDGTAQTQIILQSTVEEDLDVYDDSALEGLLGKGVKKVVLEDIKGTPTGKMIENLLSLGLQGGDSLENKSVNVEIIEEPLEAHSDEEREVHPGATLYQPSSTFIHIEELENAPLKTKHPEDSAEPMNMYMTAEEYRKNEFQVQDDFRGTGAPFLTQIQETEYFVSTPDDNVSEPEESGFSSYGHFGVVHDFSDERYYQEEPPIDQRFEESGNFGAVPSTVSAASGQAFTKNKFPACIIEEDMSFPPTEQESMLELLRDDPKLQLRGALEVRGNNISEERTVENRADVSHSELHGGYTVKVYKDQDFKVQGTPWLAGSEGQEGLSEDMSKNEEHKRQRHVLLSPTEKSFTFQMDVNNMSSGSQNSQGFYSQAQRREGAIRGDVRGGEYSYTQRAAVSENQSEGSTAHGQDQESEMRKWEGYTTEHVEFGDVLKTQIVEPSVKFRQENRSPYFENPDED